MPRKEAKTERQVTVNTVTGYHGSKFSEMRLFASDRPRKLSDVENPNGYGLEMETVIEGVSIDHSELYADILKKMVFPDAGFHADLWRLEHDSSLHGSRVSTSAECVSQVMTKAYIRNNYPAWKAMYDTSFRRYSISCNKTCGMHTNVSIACFGKTKESQELAIRKLYFAINMNYSFFRDFFHRDAGSTNWCGRMPCSLEYAKKELKVWDGSGNGSHGYCLNLSHTLGQIDRRTNYIDPKGSRVEIRLVGGQPNFAAFRNTMEAIFWTVEHICKLPWEKLGDPIACLSGCNQYVFDRLTYCRNQGSLSADVVEAIRPTVKEIEGLL